MDEKNKIIISLTVILMLSTSVTAFGAAALGLIDVLLAEAIKLVAKGWIVSSAWQVLGLFLERIFDSIPLLLTSNPPLSEITPGMFFFIKIIAPFYISAILFLTLYLIIISASASGRAKAKGMLTSMVLGLILISISPVVLKILLMISETFSKALMPMGASMGINVLTEATGGLYNMFWKLTMVHRTGGVELEALHVTLVLALMVVLLLRQVMVILFGMLLPLAFFFYSFHSTKHIGKDLFVQSFLWIFMPVAWVLSLVIIGSMTSYIPPIIPEIYVSIGAFFFFLGSPMLLMGVSEWLSFIVLFFEILQAAPLSIGVVIVDETMK